MTEAEIEALAELESLCGEADWQIDYESRQYLALAGTIRALDAIPGLIAAPRAARADAARMREAAAIYHDYAQAVTRWAESTGLKISGWSDKLAEADAALTPDAGEPR